MNANAFPTTRVNPADLASALTSSQVNETAGGAGMAFLKFDYLTGNYSFGLDKDIVTNETICVNTTSIEHGWVLWLDGKPHKAMVPFNAPLPPAMPSREDTQGLQDPSEARGFQARFLDEDTMMLFEGSSYGVRKGVDALLSSIKLRAATGEEKYLFPIVKLDSDSYLNKKANRTIYNAYFKIIDWADVDGNKESDTKAIATPTPTSEADAPSAEEAPKRRRRKAS